MVIGLPHIAHHKTSCVHCIQAKQHHTHIPKDATFRASHPLQLLHPDLCKPISDPTSLKYILTFINDHSRFTWVYFLMHKSDTFQAFKTFQALVKKQLSTSIQMLRTDCGGEYMSTDFQHHWSVAGIHRQLTTVLTPHQNDVAKWKNKTILKSAHAIFLVGKFPITL